MANEVVDELLLRNRENFLCMLDVEKAYYHVTGGFLDYMLRRLGSGTNGASRSTLVSL